MAATDNYRRQHDELVKIVTEISKFLDKQKLESGAEQVVTMLSQFSGKIKMHLALEDESLYPRLLSHSDSKIKDMAQKFQKEMGAIKPQVEAYSKKWLTAKNIHAQPDVFITETKGLFEALANRIKRENTELYAAFDKI